MNAKTKVIDKKYLKLDEPILKEVSSLIQGTRKI